MRAYSAGGVVFRLATVHDLNRDLMAGQESTTWTIEPSASLEHTGPGVAVDVALVGRSHAGIWTLPKGTPEHGETIEQVATREVQEETGLQVRLIAYIGSISFSFVRDQVRYHKQVRHFLFEAIGGDTALHDHEYDQAEWFPLQEACRRLTYQNEVNILYQAEEVLYRWLQRQHKEGTQ